jgi:methyltransferase (TIGR00027 family)
VIPARWRELRRSDRPSVTALWVTFGRALELRRPFDQRIVSDEYAPVFLPSRARRLAERLPTGGGARSWLERNAAAGLGTYVLCRHAYLDRQLLRALDAGVEQVVILGAGYDARAYRFAEHIWDRAVFEVDLPPLSRAKAELVASRPDVFGPPRVHRVEVDFQTDSLDERLRAGGLRAGAPTVVVWEGVAPYLPPQAVTATLDTLAGLCGPGSRLGMDLWDGGGPGVPGALRRAVAQSFRLVGEPVRSGLPVDDARRLLAAHGWDVDDVADAGVLTERYATDGRISERSLYVLSAARSA